MMSSNRILVLLIVTVSLLGSLLAMQGCNKNGGGGPGDAALVAAGKTVYDANNCAKCHLIAGQGSSRGRDLTKVGADVNHTPQWIVEHVKNPRTHNPNSRMPAFQGKIEEKDLAALGAYLASLK